MRPFQPAPEIQRLLDKVKQIGNDLDAMTRENIPVLRAARELRVRNSLWAVPVEQVRDLTVPGKGNQNPVPTRLYIPLDKQLARDGRLPLVIFFHGGGWTLGSPAIYDSVTRQLARQIPALVLSVGYRLAPESPFPAAVQDADAVLWWVSRHAEEIGADPTRIVVAGDSAGGNLAIVSTRRAQAQANGRMEMSVVMHALFYPSTDIASTDYESYEQYGEGYLLTRRSVEQFREFYLPRASDWTLPDVSPLRASDMRGTPPTLLIGAGCDPIRVEGEAYARKLRDSGVRVIYRLEPNLIHAFLNLYNLDPDCSPYAEGVLGYAAGVIRQHL